VSGHGPRERDSALLLDPGERRDLWERIGRILEDYVENVREAPVAPPLDLERLRAEIEGFDLASGQDPRRALDWVAAHLWADQVHTPHPRYFGLFNPAPSTMGIAADALVAGFNPQLAAWSHSPFAAQIEAFLVRVFAERFGFGPHVADGTFTSGGAEANHTALLTALVARFPEYAEGGSRALPGQPVFYVSSAAHHSFVKAARFCGIGTEAIRKIAVDGSLVLDLGALERAIAEDRRRGDCLPFLLVGTAGSTSAGAVDPLPDLGAIARREGLWFHADAAWGGAAALVPELRALLDGIEVADSITFDAHKQLSVPMGAGLYLTRHPEILGRTCAMSTDYMPRDGAHLDAGVDPYGHSMQWSRRFIGLKVFLSLAVAGWEGYAETLRGQVAMGDALRRRLEADEWRILNPATRLPVVCFGDPGSSPDDAERLARIARRVVESGQAWISTVELARDTPALRACITNFRTREEDLDILARCLREARART
jgi:glutamate/tyrosine decarboxylase-like PLP-dependent enzyme